MTTPEPKIGDFQSSGDAVFVSNATPHDGGGRQPCVKQWADSGGPYGGGWAAVPLATVADEIARRGLRLATYDPAIAASDSSIAQVDASSGGIMTARDERPVGRWDQVVARARADHEARGNVKKGESESADGQGLDEDSSKSSWARAVQKVTGEVKC